LRLDVLVGGEERVLLQFGERHAVVEGLDGGADAHRLGVGPDLGVLALGLQEMEEGCLLKLL